MDLRALIVEQLEADGSLRSFRMAPGQEPLTVAFPDEYQEQRSGPFHFLNCVDEDRFREGFASAQVRQVGIERFIIREDSFIFKTSWQGIPTERNYLSYYALSLPEFAVPERIRLTDPHSGREYNKHVTRDDDRNRFVIYIECRSSIAIFDFELETEFRISPTDFQNAKYRDEKTDTYGRQIDGFTPYLNENDDQKVQNFFSEKINVNNNYNVTSMPSGHNPDTDHYYQSLWERILSYVVAICTVGVVGWLVIRNEPFKDPNLVLILRIVLSLAIAILGATIPGFLRLNWKGKGLAIRAGGALALFVLTFFFTPTVIPHTNEVSPTSPFTIWRLDKQNNRWSLNNFYFQRKDLESIRGYSNFHTLVLKKLPGANTKELQTAAVLRLYDEERVDKGASLFSIGNKGVVVIPEEYYKIHPAGLHGAFIDTKRLIDDQQSGAPNQTNATDAKSRAAD